MWRLRLDLKSHSLARILLYQLASVILLIILSIAGSRTYFYLATITRGDPGQSEDGLARATLYQLTNAIEHFGVLGGRGPYREYFRSVRWSLAVSARSNSLGTIVTLPTPYFSPTRLRDYEEAELRAFAKRELANVHLPDAVDLRLLLENRCASSRRTGCVGGMRLLEFRLTARSRDTISSPKETIRLHASWLYIIHVDSPEEVVAHNVAINYGAQPIEAGSLNWLLRLSLPVTYTRVPVLGRSVVFFKPAISGRFEVEISPLLPIPLD